MPGIVIGNAAGKYLQPVRHSGRRGSDGANSRTPGLSSYGLCIMAGATLLFPVFAHSNARPGRIEGGIFLAGYGLFPALLVYRSLA